MSHSPTPWVAEQLTHDSLPVRINGACSVIRDAAGQEAGAVVLSSTAEHIVRCVNLHDEVVKLLDEASYYVALSEDEGCQDAHRLHTDIAILLEKARGE